MLILKNTATTERAFREFPEFKKPINSSEKSTNQTEQPRRRHRLGITILAAMDAARARDEILDGTD